MQKAINIPQVACPPQCARLYSVRRSAPRRTVRAAVGGEDQMKAMKAAMQNPEVAGQMAAMQEQMSSPEVQAQMADMQNVMANPAFQSKMAELREDPELKATFDEIKAGGMGAMMKFMNDPAFLAKIGEKMGDVLPTGQPEAPPAQGRPAPPPGGVTNILDAVRYADMEAIEDFAAIGKLDSVDPEQRGVLHYAVGYDVHPAFNILLDKGANVDAKDKGNNTPLHYAAGYARTHYIKALVGAGADVGVVNSDGDRAVDVVTKEPRNPLNQDAEMLALLRG